MSVARKSAVAAGEADSALGELMKAVVQDRFGPPETLRLVNANRPEIGSGEVLLKVHAAAVNPYDWHMLRGDPRVARLMGGVGLTRPKARIAGVDVAGRIHDVGADVHGLRPGDEVFEFAKGAFAEYATTDAALVVPKPAVLSFEQAAALPMAAVTALHAIRDRGRVQPGQRVLVNGAAGGVGTFAVQIAAALGAEVTGVCSTRNTDMVRSIGATHDHSRGLMPSQIEPGRWAEKDIRQWLHRRRVRPSPEATRTLCDKLARAARRTATPNDRRTVEALVDQARAINIAWTTIGRALEISGQAAWARYHRRPSTSTDART